MIFQSFQSRILIFFIGLFVLVQAAAFFALDTINNRNAAVQINHDLVKGSQIFQRLFQARTERLADAVKILSSDFAFREAISTNDQATILSVLENNAERINADIVMLVSMENRLIADIQHPQLRNMPFPFPELMRTAEQSGKSSAVVAIGKRSYQLVMVPVFAPDPIAWICIGFVIDNKLATELQKLTSLDVLFMSTEARNRSTITAASLPMSAQTSLAKQFKKISWTPQAIVPVNLDNDKNLALMIPLATASDRSTSAFLLQSQKEAWKPYQRLRNILVVLFVCGFLVTTCAAVLISRSIAKPLRFLAESARKVAAGDYETYVSIWQKNELGDLANAFNHMSKTVALREAEIKYQAYHDNITGLPNRLYLQEFIQQSIDKAIHSNSQIALVLMDLDRFKEINDTLGHHLGDVILQQIGPRLRKVVGQNDMVARLGGDEFAVLLNDIRDDANASEAVDKIIAALKPPFPVNNLPLEIAASCGIALYPSHADEAATLIQHADIAMYIAKRSAKGCAFYSPELNPHSVKRLTQISELRHAIEEGGLGLYYQPKVDLKLGNIISVEALARWLHPRYGFIPPDEFIPLAEQTGLIKPLTHWAVSTALLQCAAWDDDGIALTVAVNLSARNLLDPELPDQILQKLQERNVAPQQLILEITESAIMSDPDCAMRVITRLNEAGIRLAIDDFGTGYSSLAYLKKLPVHELKIDRSFVRDMHDDANDAVIVRSTVDLAHNLGLKVTAEGVETKEVMAMLKNLNCDLAQGYLISRPVPAPELLPLLQSEVNYNAA